MAIPNKSDLLGLDYSANGQPFVSVPTKTQDTPLMDWSYNAQPFVTNPSGSAPVVTSIKKFLGVAQASIKKAVGVELAAIKKLVGVSNVS